MKTARCVSILLLILIVPSLCSADSLTFTFTAKVVTCSCGTSYVSGFDVVAGDLITGTFGFDVTESGFLANANGGPRDTAGFLQATIAGQSWTTENTQAYEYVDFSEGTFFDGGDLADLSAHTSMAIVMRGSGPRFGCALPDGLPCDLRLPSIPGDSVGAQLQIRSGGASFGFPIDPAAGSTLYYLNAMITSVVPVPEPPTLALLTSGLLGLALLFVGRSARSN